MQSEVAFVVLAKRFNGKALERQFEVASMQDVELAKWDAAGAHLFQGALIFAAPSLGEGEIVQLNAFWFQQGLGLAGYRAPPVDQCPEHVEEQSLYPERCTGLLTCAHSIGLSSPS